MKSPLISQNTAVSFTSAETAVEAMFIAGARFRMLPRSDSLEPSFVYEMTAGGDLERCRAIFKAVKQKPPPFWPAFLCVVQKIAERSQESTGAGRVEAIHGREP